MGNALIAAQLNFGVIFTASICIGWAIGLICIITKFDRNQKFCFISDLIKLTFTSVTLWFSGYIFMSVTFPNMIYASSTLPQRLIAFSDYSEELRRYVPPYNDPERLSEYYSVISDWFSRTLFLNTTREDGSLLWVIIYGDTENPMEIRCTLHLNKTILQYENVSCDAEWG